MISLFSLVNLPSSNPELSFGVHAADIAKLKILSSKDRSKTTLRPFMARVEHQQDLALSWQHRVVPAPHA